MIDKSIDIKLLNGCKIHGDGTLFWYKNGKRHREDGPAIIWYDGRKEWYLDDKRIFVSSNKEFKRIVALKAFY